MTLEEAIETSKEAAVYLAIHHQDRLVKGIGLGIEAIKGFLCGRAGLRTEFFTPLPGETKDYIPRDIGKLPSDED